MPTLLKYSSPLPLSKASTHTSTVLTTCLPPLLAVNPHNQQQTIAYPSSTPLTNAELVALEETLNSELKKNQSRMTGIDPTREQIYDELLLELIRISLIGSEERGLLLLKVKEEYERYIKTYRRLYESAVAYGVRKSLLVEVETSERAKKKEADAAKLKALTEELAKLEAEVKERKDSIATEKDQIKEERENKIKSMKSENGKLKEQLIQKISQMKKL
jgi:dynein light intermediate chain, axonemal